MPGQFGDVTGLGTGLRAPKRGEGTAVTSAWMGLDVI